MMATRGLSSFCGSEDEALHPMHSKAPQNCPAGQCNSHDALPAGHRYPSHSKKARLEWQRYSSSHLLCGATQVQAILRSRPIIIDASTGKWFGVLPTEHRLSRRGVGSLRPTSRTDTERSRIPAGATLVSPDPVDKFFAGLKHLSLKWRTQHKPRLHHRRLRVRQFERDCCRARPASIHPDTHRHRPRLLMGWFAWWTRRRAGDGPS
jgi:hypothetical protein